MAFTIPPIYSREDLERYYSERMRMYYDSGISATTTASSYSQDIQQYVTIDRQAVDGFDIYNNSPKKDKVIDVRKLNKSLI